MKEIQSTMLHGEVLQSAWWRSTEVLMRVRVCIAKTHRYGTSSTDACAVNRQMKVLQ